MNSLNNDGKTVSTHRVIFNITKNIGLLLKVRNPRQVFLTAWLEILQELEQRRSKMKITKVEWKFPNEGWMKYNIDVASRGNPGVSSYAFFLRD